MYSQVILFAEDEDGELKLMQRVLEAEGYRVLAATTGVEAVELHRRHKDEIALVVLDMNMPELRGWDAFQEMKRDDPQVKAVIATASPNPEVRSAMARGELHGLFIKPYSINDFIGKVSDLIR